MREFILSDSRQIRLQRPVFEKTPTGGYKKSAWEVLPEQTFRLVPYKRRLTDLVTSVADGEIPTLLYVLVGFWDADMKRMDEFELDGSYYRIQSLEPHTAVEEYTDRKVAQLTSLQPEGVEWVVPDDS
ncbi:hypothetical protein ACWIG4_30145 [Streptomyces sp. NPDC002248]